MILRKPTKIVLKMEHDMTEYDEYKKSQQLSKRSQAYMTPNNRKADFQNNLDWGQDISNSNHDFFNRHEMSGSNYNPDLHEDINHLLHNINPHEEGQLIIQKK